MRMDIDHMYYEELLALCEQIGNAGSGLSEDFISEAKVAEDARRRVEEEATAEAKRKRDLERESTRQTLLKMERSKREIRESKLQELMNKHFAASSVPKGIHCLSLRLTDEYSSNAHARRQLPSSEFLPVLSNNSYYHFILSSDNILAATVVLTSIVQSSLTPEKIVLHVITDKKTYAGMHSWFALNAISPAIIEVKGVHQFDWLTRDNVPVLEAVENHNGIRNYYHGNHIPGTNVGDTVTPRSFASKLQARIPKYISLLNHLHIYLPEMCILRSVLDKCLRLLGFESAAPCDTSCKLRYVALLFRIALVF
ncbi:unnamed protein product [Lactuca saligna]|uniref:Hexosyltransferase n=1 Tax=Lactuca saligna TaxID=75948 RepID=A0AA36A1T3_LACSI|nr:unnamed protein product [Lactuca saligna]